MEREVGQALPPANIASPLQVHLMLKSSPIITMFPCSPNNSSYPPDPCGVLTFAEPKSQDSKRPQSHFRTLPTPQFLCVSASLRHISHPPGNHSPPRIIHS